MAFDPISLALSKGYTKDTAEGMGAVQGKPGPAGKDGVTPDIQVGAVTTLEPGQEATVTRRENSPDAAPVFDFGIPKGAKGDPGSGGGEGGSKGDPGTTFTPSVSEEGVLSWTNDGGLPNPEPVDIKGPPGGGTDITAGDGLNKDGSTLSVDNPVRGIMTQGEYDALPEAQKAKGTYFVDDGAVPGPCWETYSTQEQRIGTWINGKPLYKKTITGTGGGNNIFIADNVDAVTHLDGIAINSAGGMIGLPSYVSASDCFTVKLESGKLHTVSNRFTAYAISVTVYYTKTTDQATEEVTA